MHFKWGIISICITVVTAVETTLVTVCCMIGIFALVLLCD